MPVDSVLARIPGYGGFAARRAQIEEGDTREIQRAGVLQQLMQKQQEQQKAQQFQQEVSAARTPEERLAVAQRYMGANQLGTSIQSSQDRAATLEAANTNRAATRDQTAALQSERIAAQAEAARVRAADETRTETQRAQDRAMLVRLTASLRPAPVDQPLQAYTDPVTGKPKLGTRAEARGNAPAVKETADRVIPANIAKAYTENATALRKIDSALSEVDKYPDAFGLQNMRGDALSQRMDPKGVTARAIVSDIGSLKIHDRSGAAVTAAETPRLLPFIPGVNDNAATIKKKLALFRKEYAAIQDDIGSMYSAEQGYRALPSAQTRSSDKIRIRFDAQGNPVRD